MTRPLPIVVVLLAGCGGPDGGRSRPDPEPTSTETTPPTDSGLTTAPPVATLSASGPVSCSDPGLRQSEGWWDRTELPLEPIETSLLRGGGLVVNDLDGDGLLDVLVVSDGLAQLWVQRPGNVWLEEWSSRLPDLPLERASAASSADYDGDGDFDLFLTRDARTDFLLRNDGGQFVDVTADSGIAVRGWRSMASSWADWDGDGDLDLSVATYSRDQPNAFWENQGDGSFTEVTLLPPEMDDGLTFQLTWHDLGGDGLPELFVANDHANNGADTAFFTNLGGGVLERDDSVGYHPDFDGMGVVLADFDGDGLPDIAETTWKGVSLLEGAEVPGTPQDFLFVDVTSAVGLRVDRIAAQQRFSWGIDAGDLDHDGDLDLVATWGLWEHGDFQILEQPDSIWLQQGGQFVEQPPHDYGAGRAELLVDVNGDGWLDVVKRVLKEPTVVDLARCGEGHWLTIGALDSEDSLNRYGIGVTVRVTAGEDQWVRWIEAGSRSMYSSGPPRVHVGLGGHEEVDAVELIWPDGRTVTFADVAADQHLTVQMVGDSG